MANTAPVTEFLHNQTPAFGMEPIGYVDTLEGSVSVFRADGMSVELEVGHPVFQGDEIMTASDSAVGLVLADQTAFSMAENGRITLDEMVYEPASQEGSIALSVGEGIFTFISGEIAKTDPEAMVIDTPVATIGIRGTQLGVDIADGETLNSLQPLLDYRRVIKQVSEWPFDSTVMFRLLFYFIIPPLTWVGAALIERLVDTVNF